jgi:RNA polymerase sigma-70 factor (ECF subfamily)
VRPDPLSAREGLLEHQAFLRRLARSLVADPHAAEDLAQDAAVIALERPPQGDESLRGWFARVVRNRAIDAARREHRRQAREQTWVATRPPRTPEETEEQLQVQRRVFEAVAALEEPYRTAILLRYYHELGPTEIATELGVPVSTVKSRLARALAQLREQLDDSQTKGERAWAIVLAGGLCELHRPVVATTLAAGGIAMGTKLALGVAAVVAMGFGGWWLARPDVAPAQVADASKSPPASPLPLALPDGPDLHDPPPDAGRIALSATGAASVPTEPTAAPDWTLQIDLRGWNESDTGLVSFEIRRNPSDEPVVASTHQLARELTLDLGPLFVDATARPDQFTLRIDHQDFLPAELGVLVPEHLRQPAEAKGSLDVAVELERAKATVTGTVSVHEGFAVASARVAIFALEGKRPAKEPIEVVRLDASGRFRLRADQSQEHAVVAFVQASRGDPTLRPETRRVLLESGRALELDPIFLGEGECISGRVVLLGGGSPPPGRVRADLPKLRGGNPFDLEWKGECFEIASVEQRWSENGEFRLTGLGPQIYRVLPAVASSLSAIPTIYVEDSTSTEVEIVPPAADVSLVLDVVEITFGILGKDAPVAGATVKATWKVGPTNFRGSWVRTDELGRAAVVLDPANGLDLEITDARWPFKQVSFTPEELTPFRVIEIQLEGAPQQLGSLAIRCAGDRETLSGTVVDLDLYEVDRYSPEDLKFRLRQSSVVSGYVGRAPPPRGLGKVNLWPSWQKLEWAEVDGTWVVSGLPPGRFVARLSPRAATSPGRCVLLRQDFEFELEPGQRHDIEWRAEAGGSLRLNLTALTNLRSGGLKDAEGAKLNVRYLQDGPTPGSIHGGSGIQGPGLYDVNDALPAGTYELALTLEDGSKHSLPVKVEAGKVLDVTVGPDDLR